MDASLTAELSRICEALTIISPGAFSFAGRVTQQTDSTALLSLLQQQLYQYGYCRRFEGRLTDDPPATADDGSWLETLSASNTSRELWDGGWHIQHLLPSGQVLAQKGSLTRSLWPGEFLSQDGPGIAPRIGMTIMVFVARESRAIQPGFYFAFGEALADQQADDRFLRFYWNITAEGAPELTRSITQRLNRFQVPFRFKCLSVRSMLTRSDSAVLYIGRRFYRITVELLAAVHAALRPQLRADTPLFTKPIAPGLGLAEDPGNGESFGMSRCRLLAQGIWAAYSAGEQSVAARLRQIQEQFEQSGLSLAQPYLNPGSVDRYPLPTHDGA